MKSNPARIPMPKPKGSLPRNSVPLAAGSPKPAIPTMDMLNPLVMPKVDPPSNPRNSPYRNPEYIDRLIPSFGVCFKPILISSDGSMIKLRSDQNNTNDAGSNRAKRRKPDPSSPMRNNNTPVSANNSPA